MSNELIETFQKTLEIVVDEARVSLINRDGIQNAFFVSEDGKKYEVLKVTLKPELKPEESMQMKLVCRDPSVAIAALIMDAYTRFIPTENFEEVSKPLKDYPDHMEALLLYIYTRDQSFVRVMPYWKNGPRDYGFADQGWSEATNSEGLFENVFKE